MLIAPSCAPVAPSRRRFLLTAAALAPATAAWAQSSGLSPLEVVAAQSGVRLSGIYRDHLQGVTSNGRDTLYWSMTTRLVKTDVYGAVVQELPVAFHHGDLCYLDGRLYVAVNLALFNDPRKRSDSWIYVYDAEDFKLIRRQKADEVVYGAGGMAFGDGRFLVVGGLPSDGAVNHVYEYSRDLKFVREIALKTGHTELGIQTAAYHEDHWWFGCYGRPATLLKANRTLDAVQKFTYDASLGILPVDRQTFLIGHGDCARERTCVAALVPARLEEWIAKGILLPVS